MTRRFKPARLFVAAMFLVVLGIVTYAFTAANTVPGRDGLAVARGRRVMNRPP
jgi:hypothetical protein